MSCRIILVTHGPLADALCEAVSTMRDIPKNVVTISLGVDRSLADVAERLNKEMEAATLVLTDLPAGTTTNAACLQLQRKNVEVVTGVNLPMILSAIANQDRLALSDLAQKVWDDAHRGILNLRSELADRSNSD